ncbi:hypothetical protein M426DRAFT_315891 [Hypoxylon sp. CI-4A]|nr:hypothetical protein M426DRAFT_315891 [Hypoxylon sp. CI-4A]
MSGTPFRLLDLPVEVVNEFCRSLTPATRPPYLIFKDYDDARETIKDLVNLSRTCKVLYFLSSIHLRNYQGQHPFHDGMLPYAHGIIRNAELAARETSFRFLPTNIIGPVQEGDAEILDATASQLGLLPPSRHLQVYNNHASAHWARPDFAYILMDKLPNLASVTMYSYDGATTRMPTSRERHLSLPNLKHARLIGFDPMASGIIRHGIYSHNLQLFSKLFSAASNIETIELERLIVGLDTLNEMEPRLRSISITASTIACRNKQPDIGPHVETFIYKDGSYDQNVKYQGLSSCKMWAHGIVEAVRKRFHSLKTLEIDVPTPLARDVKDSRRNLTMRFIDTLRVLPRLKNITLSQPALWDQFARRPERYCFKERLVALLPDAAESFTLYDVSSQSLPCILHLASYVKDDMGLPNLKTVRFRPAPSLARELRHATGHEGDRDLPFHDETHRPCLLHASFLSQHRMIVRFFARAGVDVQFPLEILPLRTDCPELLERHDGKQHWCADCHFDTLGCLERPRYEADCLASRANLRSAEM